MKKKKTPATIEKQTVSHLQELYLRLIVPTVVNPDFWQELLDDDYRKYLSVIALWQEERDAGLCSEEDFELAKQKLDYWMQLKLSMMEEVENIIKSCMSDDALENPIDALMEKLELSLEMLVEYLESLCPREMPAPSGWLISNAGLRFIINLQFTDNKIIKALNRHLEIFLSPVGQRNLDSQGLRPQLADGRVLEVIRNPGKDPYKDPMLIVCIDFSAGKMKIRKELDELLKELSPRDTKPSPKFSVGTWETDYQIYVLHHEERFTFKEIAAKLNMPPSTVKSAFQRIYKHIHQTDEYGTKESREGLCVDITKELHKTLERAEVHYARMQMIGGTRRRSDVYEEPPVGFPDQEIDRPRIRVCGLDCKFQPGSEGCLYCNQAPEPIYYSRQQRMVRINPGKAVKRTAPLEDKTLYPLKSEPEPSHYKEIDEVIQTSHLHLPRDEEHTLQAEYIKEHGTTPVDWVGCCPACATQSEKPEDGTAGSVPHSTSEWYQRFSWPKDRLESFLIDQIDRRANKSHQK